MQTPEGRAAFINSQVACAQIEAAGMVAENTRRASLGQSNAYGEDDFERLIHKYGIHHNAVVTFLSQR